MVLTQASEPAVRSVVLVHGIATKKWVLLPLVQRFRSNGYLPIPFLYPSLFRNIEVHAKRLYQQLIELGKEEPYHIVAHSMGSIVTRAAMLQGELPNLKRVVLLAPPNQGSPVARFASRLLGRISRPTAELSDSPSSFVRNLPLPTHERIAIVAGRYDCLVPVENTRLENVWKHLVLAETHNSLLWSRNAFQTVVRYLEHGSLQSGTEGDE